MSEKIDFFDIGAFANSAPPGVAIDWFAIRMAKLPGNPTPENLLGDLMEIKNKYGGDVTHMRFKANDLIDSFLRSIGYIDAADVFIQIWFPEISEVEA